MCSAQGGCWLLRHGSLLLPMGNTGMSCAEHRSVAGMRQQRAGLQEPAEGEVGSLESWGCICQKSILRTVLRLRKKGRRWIKQLHSLESRGLSEMEGVCEKEQNGSKRREINAKILQIIDSRKAEEMRTDSGRG